jgi:hypothetical protein
MAPPAIGICLPGAEVLTPTKEHARKRHDARVASAKFVAEFAGRGARLARRDNSVQRVRVESHRVC